MLGHRGCRLGISFLKYMRCNVGNIWSIVLLKKDKIKSAFVEIMIPLVSTDSELMILGFGKQNC